MLKLSSKIIRNMNKSVMNKLLNGNLKAFDPTMHKFIQEENQRQHEGLELIASDNFTSKPVIKCLGSVLTNKYSEGLPGARYYGGNEIIDKIENLCRTRALSTYRLNPEKWGFRGTHL